MDVIQDRQKHMEFGLYYCMEDEFKASGSFSSKIFLDTFSIHYRYTLPKNLLPNWDTPIPVGGLALAAAAVNPDHSFYQS